MRCVACNKILSDYEATRKHAITGEYLDLCNECFSSISEVAMLPTHDRKDLLTEIDVDQELEEIDDNREM